MPNQAKPSVQWAMTVLVLLFVFFAVLLWKAGFLTFTGTDPSSKVVASALALVGAFFAAIMSIVGILLKYSVDLQTESRLELESTRNNALQLDAENRLKLEAGIRAVQLLATNEGKPSPPIQRTGALLTLVSLGQFDLTLLLVSDLLARGDVEPSTAAEVINRALVYGDAAVQRDAINIYFDHAERMLTPTGAVAPRCLMDGFEGLPEYVREWGAVALGSIMAARPVVEWSKVQFEAAAFLSALSLGWYAEGVPRIKNEIGATLAPILRAFPQVGTLFHPKRKIDTSEIRLRVSSLHAVGEPWVQLVARLNMWAEPGGETGAPEYVVPSSETPR